MLSYLSISTMREFASFHLTTLLPQRLASALHNKDVLNSVSDPTQRDSINTEHIVPNGTKSLEKRKSTNYSSIKKQSFPS